MNLQFYIEKLQHSDIFKNFKEENPDAYLCGGFFVVDKTEGNNKQHFDYFVNRKIFSFQVEEGKMVPVDVFDDKVFEKISEDIDLDFKEIERIILDKMEEENIKNKVQKILLSLQCKDGKCFILGTVFVSMLGLIKVRVDLDEKKIVSFEKKSFFDMMKIIRK